MPVVSLTLEEISRTILSSSYFRIIESVVEVVKIPKESVVVVYKDKEYTTTDNRPNATSSSADNLPFTVSNKRIYATITEEYNENALTTTAVHQLSAYPVFIDKDIDVYIYPIYIKTDIEIEFSFVSPSKSEAIRLRDDLRIRLSQTRNINMHEIEYSILIPSIVEDFIIDVYELKNRLQPQTLEDYFREHSTKRLYPITDMGNSANTRLAIHEKQVRIIGTFDFNSMPEKLDVDNSTNNYKLTFVYKLSIDVPRAIVLRYPTMICNRALPSKYISFIEEHRRTSREEHKANLGYTKGLYALSHFEAHRQLENRVDINLPINVPAFDEFNVRQGHTGYAVIVSFLVQVDESDKKSLLNLNDIDPFSIPDVILNHIRTTDRLNVVEPYKSFLYIGLHQDGRHFDNNVLEIDENLNVRSKTELSLFKPVRITISMSMDISLLNRKILSNLIDNPELLYTYLNEYINAYNNFKADQDNQILTENTLYKNLIQLIQKCLSVGKFDIIKQIAVIVNRDKYISIKLGNLLRNGYAELYSRLERNNILRVDPLNFEIHPATTSVTSSMTTYTTATPIQPTQESIDANRSDVESTGMKTVLEYYLLVSKKQ